jgi:uncharacterized protein
MLSHEIATKNNIGTKENNNGVLFLVAKEDRQMRIEVGYGLEGALPDATSNSIIRNEVTPLFREGNYTKGVVAGLNAIVAATRGEYTATEPKDEDNGKKGFSWFWLLFLIFFFILPRIRGGKRLGSGMIYYGGGFGGGSSGGSFGGGGFGGFSGGGGSFGGGGSSGSW